MNRKHEYKKSLSDDGKTPLSGRLVLSYYDFAFLETYCITAAINNIKAAVLTAI